MRMSGKIAVTGLCLLAVLGAASPATARTTTRQATFKVEVEGVQKTTWSMDHDDPFGLCGAHSVGSGSERMTFASKRATRVKVVAFGSFVSFLVKGKPASFLVPTKVNRSGTLTVTPHPGGCADGGEGGAPPAPPQPDCGRRTSSIDVELAQSFRRKTSIMLTNGDLTPLVGYKHCPVAGTAYPDLLASTTSGRPIDAPMPARDLLNPKLRKHMTIGRGTMVSNAGGTSTKTTVSWTVTFTRVGR